MNEELKNNIDTIKKKIKPKETYEKKIINNEIISSKETYANNDTILPN